MELRSTLSKCFSCQNGYTYSRKKIRCDNCNYDSCLYCYKRYIDEKPNDYAHCMNCKTLFNRIFMHDNFTESYLKNKYKTHLKKIWFDEQSSKFPDTQISIQNDRSSKKRNILRVELRELIYDEIKFQDKETFLKNIYNISEELYDINKFIEDSPIKNRKAYFYGYCPEDNCKGFLTSKFQCALCETFVCKTCKEKLSDDHECNKDTIKNEKYLRRFSKPCPSCKVPIMRTSGCPQMFCTRCNVGFLWNSLNIVKNLNSIHNPHLTEWLEERYSKDDYKTEDDLNLPSYRRPVRVYINKLPGNKLNRDRALILGVKQYTLQLDDMGIQTISDVINDFETKLESNRKSYLLNNMSHKVFEINIAKIYKRKEYLIEVRNLLSLLRKIFEEILDNFLKGEYTYKEIAEKIHDKISHFNLDVNTLQTAFFYAINKPLKCRYYKYNSNTLMNCIIDENLY